MKKMFSVTSDNIGFSNNTGNMKASTYDEIVSSTGRAYLLEYATQLKDRKDLAYDQKKQELKVLFDKLYAKGFCGSTDLAKAYNRMTWKGSIETNPVVEFIKRNKESFRTVEIPNGVLETDYLGYAVSDTIRRIETL